MLYLTSAVSNQEALATLVNAPAHINFISLLLSIFNILLFLVLDRINCFLMLYVV